jgi:hypothetical protein
VKSGRDEKVCGSESSFNAKGQRVKGSKNFLQTFVPLTLCPLALKRFSLPANFLVMPKSEKQATAAAKLKRRSEVGRPRRERAFTTCFHFSLFAFHFE